MAASGDRAKSFIPRHREIGVGVARAICRQLGVPPIRKWLEHLVLVTWSG